MSTFTARAAMPQEASAAAMGMERKSRKSVFSSQGISIGRSWNKCLQQSSGNELRNALTPDYDGYAAHVKNCGV